MDIRFACPACDYPAGRLDRPGEWQCPRCDHLVRLPEVGVDPALAACALCGNSELYKKKDFPHSLGMTILALACLASTLTYWLYHKWWTWAILIGSAAFDGLLYLWVKDAVVCYRCGACYRGIAPGSAPRPVRADRPRALPAGAGTRRTTAERGARSAERELSAATGGCEFCFGAPRFVLRAPRLREFLWTPPGLNASATT